VLGGVVIASAVAALLVWRVPVSYARIYKDGILTEAVNLAAVAEGYTIVVEGNAIEVEPGRIRVSDADCPDVLCVRQGWARGGLVPIVCLPNRLVIVFDGGGDGDVDAVVG